jgi:hypothetical protein
MKYDLSHEHEANSAKMRLAYLTARKKLIEVREVKPSRSLQQNAYLHLIIGAFGNHFGYTLTEAKQIYKELNAGIYRYKKKDRVFWRSSADLDKEEMAASIDKFMQKSAESGYPLPAATDHGWLMEIENEIERSKYHLN